MTAFSSSLRGKGRRAAAAAGAVSLGLLVLSACDQPTPRATVTAGQDTVTAEASCYEDGKTLGDLTAKEKAEQAKFEKCMTSEPDQTLTVHPGDKVRLGVEPDMAEQGWIAMSNGMPMTSLSKQTYTSIDSDQVFYNQQTRQMSDSTTISIMTSKGGKYTGIWNIKLNRASS
ncbi:hypothetical protein AB0I82_30205 [Streptomyces sp. NPDC050315]|uniref:hypothetical protein n=1 Tax=Streptomyces sp. NPDC050315 TaxID=3155039 RepID=UPI0034231D4A